MGRIRYGLKNLYYAVATEGTGGALTYATPVAVPGAKSISLAPAGTAIDEPADDVTWFHKDTNDGYTGSIEFEDTAAGDSFLATVLGMTTDTKDVVFEAASDEYKEFALLGQFTLRRPDKRGWRPDSRNKYSQYHSYAENQRRYGQGFL